MPACFDCFTVRDHRLFFFKKPLGVVLELSMPHRASRVALNARLELSDACKSCLVGSTPPQKRYCSAEALSYERPARQFEIFFFFSFGTPGCPDQAPLLAGSYPPIHAEKQDTAPPLPWHKVFGSHQLMRGLAESGSPPAREEEATVMSADNAAVERVCSCRAITVDEPPRSPGGLEVIGQGRKQKMEIPPCANYHASGNVAKSCLVSARLLS